MHDIELGAVDLNLLVVLDVLLEERSVSRTAERIGRTQSATSHALARLRDALGDPLLVRVGSDMMPTPRAERLQTDLRRVLQSLERVLVGQEEFDPQRSERIFTVAGPDFLAAHASSLMRDLKIRAPAARFELLPPSPQMFQDLTDGKVDLVVSPPPSRRLDGVEGTPLAQLSWSVFARPNHPGIRGWSIRKWSRYEHLQVRTGRSRSPVDIAAEQVGRTRTVAAWLPSFHAAAALVAQTDLLFTAPRAVLGEAAKHFDLVELKCPVEVEPIELAVHQATHRSMDEAVRFFADVVTTSLRAALG